MKTRLLRRLRRKAKRHIYTKPVFVYGVHFVAIAKSDYFGCVYLQPCGGWAMDEGYAQRYFDEDECLAQLQMVRRNYIMDVVGKLKSRRMSRKINRRSK